MNRIEKLKEYLEISPADSFLKHALALEYIKLGDDEKAKGFFTEILKQEPGYVASYYHLGKLLERRGAREEAVRTPHVTNRRHQYVQQDWSKRLTDGQFGISF